VAKALYRKYRSKSLSEVVGQSHVTDVLSRALEKGKIAHAYLLTGPRGVGKTSIARILAHEINKLEYSDDTTHLDIIEIDAASNNGVEDVRDLREKVQIAPVSATKKVYIIDEVHMLSKAAFNALLKTLEEPPEHVVFILATTDIEKLPATIISRTQRFHFRSITPEDAVKHLRYIAEKEGISIEDGALDLIAKRGEGSFRDSISLLDQLSSLADKKSGITAKLVEQALGLAPSDQVQKLLAAYNDKDLASIVKLLQELEEQGIQATVLTNQLIQTIRGQITENPHYLALLDSLLAVPKSAQPSIKLLIALSQGAIPTAKPKTAALTAPSVVISAPPAELRKQKTAPTITITPKREKKIEEQPTTQQKPQNVGTLDWGAFVEYTRVNYLATYSVLSKCGYEVVDDTVKIYTINAFYKKKLDDAKYRTNLTIALKETGAGDMAIDTIPTPPPPKDSQAAAVAAIMGGGEEVNVEA
jgi:DNA polymerase-3 subunit gamma/tau